MNIYIGNLPYRATEEELGELFGAYGTVDRTSIIKERDTGRSKGFGFVEMANDEEARKAVEELDGKNFLGRNLRVNEARPRDDSGPRPERNKGW